VQEPDGRLTFHSEWDAHINSHSSIGPWRFHRLAGRMTITPDRTELRGVIEKGLRFRLFRGEAWVTEPGSNIDPSAVIGLDWALRIPGLTASGAAFLADDAREPLYHVVEGHKERDSGWPGQLRTREEIEQLLAHPTTAKLEVRHLIPGTVAPDPKRWAIRLWEDPAAGYLP